MRYLRIVQLWIHAGQEQPFETFERRVAQIMSRHGGQIEQAVRVDAGPDAPFEVHLVSFPDEAAFEAYRGDAETISLQKAREGVIAKTISFVGRQAGPYA